MFSSLHYSLALRSSQPHIVPRKIKAYLHSTIYRNKTIIAIKEHKRRCFEPYVIPSPYDSIFSVLFFYIPFTKQRCNSYRVSCYALLVSFPTWTGGAGAVCNLSVTVIASLLAVPSSRCVCGALVGGTNEAYDWSGCRGNMTDGRLPTYLHLHAASILNSLNTVTKCGMQLLNDYPSQFDA